MDVCVDSLAFLIPSVVLALALVRCFEFFKSLVAA